MINHRLYTVEQIRQIEQRAISSLGGDEYTLMQRAGIAAFKWLCQHWKSLCRLGVLCGKGNNGGDGYVLARLAHQSGLEVKVWQAGGDKPSTMTAQRAFQEALEAGVQITPLQIESFPDDLSACDGMVDALLGIGLSQMVEGEFAKIIHILNGTGKPVLALDVPSGIHANTGQLMGCAVRAQATLTLIGQKRGLYTGQATEYVGQVYSDDLELPKNLHEASDFSAQRIQPQDMFSVLSPRAKNAHKGCFGHVLVIGGNHGMGGAPRLAAEAALRAGAGLVSVAMRPEFVVATTAARPELMCHGIQKSDDLTPLLEQATVLVMGAGLGQDLWAEELYAKALQSAIPTVIDADGLNQLAKQPSFSNHWILTPHPGEASRLLGISTEEIQADRFGAASALQARYGGVIVLKGAGTLVQAASRPTQVCGVGNPGMASGGMGDVLGGIIGGLLAQHLTLEEAASFGVYWHGLAGDYVAQAEGEQALLALDLCSALGKVLKTFR